MKALKHFIIVLLPFSLLIGCDINNCEDNPCGFNQVCNRGTCLCLDGYEGADCLTEAYPKYQGSYNISESCQMGSGHNVFFGTISASVSPINEIIFFNFLNSGQNAVAYIGTDPNNQANYIRIPNQNLGGSGFNVVGEGFYEDFGGLERIRLEIQSTENGQVKVCTLFYQ